MATIRSGSQGVLLVVDVQVGVMREVWNAQQVISNIGNAVAKARERRVPVLWVLHGDDDLVYGSADWQLVPGLSAADNEIQIHKRFNSAFEQTSLEEALAGLAATHIVLVGAATNWCIRATAHGALERGYDLTLVEDAHTTETLDLEGGIIEASDIIRELNVAMTWLLYPGRTSGTATVANVDFDVPASVRSD